VTPQIHGVLLLGAEALGDWIKPGRRLELFGFDRVSESSSVTRGLDLSRVQVLDGKVLSVAPQDEVLGASEGGPIFVRTLRDGHPVLALGFDPRRSDLVLRSAWPQFVQRAVDYLSTGDGSDWVVSWQRQSELVAPTDKSSTAPAWAGLPVLASAPQQQWWRWLTVGAVVLLLAEWLGTHRRWTS
jgi:hypothetical protein